MCQSVLKHARAPCLRVLSPLPRSSAPKRSRSQFGLERSVWRQQAGWPVVAINGLSRACMLEFAQERRWISLYPIKALCHGLRWRSGRIGRSAFMMSRNSDRRDSEVQNTVTERATVQCLLRGGIAAIPTEGVWGLSASASDLAAVQRILTIKQRSVNKGLIVLVTEWSMIDAWIAPSWPRDWPVEVGRPSTWVVPASDACPSVLTGGRKTLAVRKVTMPSLVRVVRQTGPLVSTSANRSGRPSAVSRYEVVLAFAKTVDYIANGRTGGFRGPSTIRDLVTGKILRGG